MSLDCLSLQQDSDVERAGSTMAEVRLNLAQEEARDGFGPEDDDTMCVNSFLYRGLELEEQQYTSSFSFSFTL